ncbi:MAG: antibiotic biosynthesis monooxygenase, partial [candidate division Zixibacteria bacterium]|nr:antibiotic biosynthesis monooxygenase [candidate division Zixibacteria bacterium]
MNRKYAYIWEYIVNPDHMDDFLNAYTPDGEWVKLFRGNPGYIKTELLCDRDNPLRFVTIDYWESADSWQAFLKDNSSEYE